MAENTTSEASSTASSPSSQKDRKDGKDGRAVKEQDDNSSAAPFGDDDLGRIQGILIGDHARKTDERLNVMEIALLGAIADLREETAAKLESIDARITAEAETRERAIGNLGSKVGRDVSDQGAKLDEQIAVIGEQATKIDDLRSEVESVEAGVKKSLDTAELTMGKAIDDVRVELGSDKVDRTDLSRLLRDLGDQLGTD